MSSFRIRRWLGLDWTFSQHDTRRHIWAYTPQPEEKRVFTFDTEVAGPQRTWRFGVGLELTPSKWEPEIQLYLACIGQVWLTIGWPGLYHWLVKRPSGEWRLELEIGDPWSAYGGCPVELRWQRGGWRMAGTDRSGRFNFTDWLLGRVKYSDVLVDAGECEIVMPEGRYPATYEIKECTRKRTRALRGKVSRDITFDIPGGVPIPGKGENSWDIDDDAILSTGAKWGKDTTIRSAAHEVALRILHDRYRHASLDWRPDAGFTPPTTHNAAPTAGSGEGATDEV